MTHNRRIFTWHFPSPRKKIIMNHRYQTDWDWAQLNEVPIQIYMRKTKFERFIYAPLIYIFILHETNSTTSILCLMYDGAFSNNKNLLDLMRSNYPGNCKQTIDSTTIIFKNGKHPVFYVWRSIYHHSLIRISSLKISFFVQLSPSYLFWVKGWM